MVNHLTKILEFPTSADWFVALATFLGVLVTLLAVLVALFKEEIVKLWRRPILKARLSLNPQDCHKMPLMPKNTKTGSYLQIGECYCFRIWVENTGLKRAYQVQVFAAELKRKHADGYFKKVESFLPMNLKWSHYENKIFAEGISPKMGQHCTLGLIRALDGSCDKTKSDFKFELETEVVPSTRSNEFGKGEYQLLLRIGASNCAPLEKIFQINFKGKWYDDENEMFSDGIGIITVK